MLIFPELQISDGRVVTRVSPGADNIVHDIAPMDAVRRFEADGAERLHILDVDAALGREKSNAELIHEIIASTHVPIQVAGGMRTAHQVDGWLEGGASHVVLGTLAITDPALLTDVSARYPGAIIANVATKDGFVMIDGWQTQTAFRPQDIVYDLQMTGVAGIIHFDIDRLKGDAATSLALTMEMKRNVVIPIYSSGTVNSLEDMARLRFLPDIHGVIIGRALLDGTFTLGEALEVAHQSETSPEPDLETSLSARGIQQSLKLYFAAYNLAPAQRWWNLDLRQAITDYNPYVEIWIPQEDLEVDSDKLSRRELQAAYERTVDEVDAVVVLLDGIENEAWTGFECGYARARGKYLLGVATNVPHPERARFESMCDDVVYVDPQDDRSTMLHAFAREVSARLLESSLQS